LNARCPHASLSGFESQKTLIDTPFYCAGSDANATPEKERQCSEVKIKEAEEVN
jgi:hypothetical protein